MNRRYLLAGVALCCGKPVFAGAKPAAQRLVDAAESQIGRTVIYDPAYHVLPYPGGDVPMERGVCTDVIIRAYRDGLDIDLQKMVHEDMKANFDVYPRTWGLSKTDTNIDHRRVPNLQRFLARRSAELSLPNGLSGFVAGDLVTMLLPGNLPHIGIVSSTLNDTGSKPLIIHNIGGGAAKDDVLGLYRITGRYRYLPTS